MLNFPWRSSAKDRSSMIRAEPLRLVRSEQQDRLASESFDILVVGGGVTGAYCAFDASLSLASSLHSCALASVPRW